MSLHKSDKFDQVEISDRIGQTLMGSSTLNTHDISKRVIYSESEQNATTWHSKIELFRQTDFGPI